VNKLVSEMKFCESPQNWNERKNNFQRRRLNFLISIKESYERKLAAITASISKLEEQIEANIINE
tara:strand:+ start:603 stop:797 length:195 start_codon:yes stop_codon:yes gene_type:complete